MGARADAADGAAARRSRRTDTARACARSITCCWSTTRPGRARSASRSTRTGPFCGRKESNAIPPLIELPQLLSAAEHVVDDKETEEDLKLLFAPGSSLGGARPKASVIDKDGQLDDRQVSPARRRIQHGRLGSRGSVASRSARAFRFHRPASRQSASKQVLLLKRFDREGAHRVPFLSAMSMLGAKDNETRSYMEFVDALRQHGASAQARTWRPCGGGSCSSS